MFLYKLHTYLLQIDMEFVLYYPPVAGSLRHKQAQQICAVDQQSFLLRNFWKYVGAVSCSIVLLY
jgi:hypothetical protein